MSALIIIPVVYLSLVVLTFVCLSIFGLLKSLVGVDHSDERASPRENLSTALGWAVLETPLPAFVWYSMAN